MIVHRIARSVGDLSAPGFVRSWAPVDEALGAPVNNRVVTLAPSEVTRPHDHHDTEVWVLLAGEGVVTEDGRTEQVSAGDLVVLPPLGRHSLTNTADDAPLVFLTLWWDEAAALAGAHADRAAAAASEQRPVLVLPSFPTPNGDLHVGHLAGPYLAADACVRALRADGHEARLLLGTVGHQSQVAVAARAAGASFVDFAERRTEEIVATLDAAGVTRDVFVRPGARGPYERIARGVFERLLGDGALTRERRPMWRCERCDRWLIEAFLAGRCPHCGSAETAGIECEACALPYDETDLVDAACAACGSAAVTAGCERWWLPLEPLRKQLETYLAGVRMSARLRSYVTAVLAAPLRDLPVSVPTDEGVDVGDAGIGGQRLYSAFELAARFLTAVDVAGHDEGYASWEDYAVARAPRTVTLFGFDNAYLRAFAFPAVLLAGAFAVDPPDAMVCNEFYRLGGSKFSTGRGHAIWGRELAPGGAAADPLRLHVAATRPEGRATSFTLDDYRATLDRLEGRWLPWLAGVGRRLGERFDGRVPEAGAWDAEAFQFFADVRHLRDAAARAYRPETLSPRSAAAAVAAFVQRAEEFAHLQDGPDGAGSADRTGMALELMGLRTLAAALHPLLPELATALARALGDAAPVGLAAEPAFVPAGRQVVLGPAVAAWSLAIAAARAAAEGVGR